MKKTFFFHLYTSTSSLGLHPRHTAILLIVVIDVSLCPLKMFVIVALRTWHSLASCACVKFFSHIKSMIFALFAFISNTSINRKKPDDIHPAHGSLHNYILSCFLDIINKTSFTPIFYLEKNTPTCYIEHRKGKAREAAYPQQLRICFTTAVIIASNGGYFLFPLKIW